MTLYYSAHDSYDYNQINTLTIHKNGSTTFSTSMEVGKYRTTTNLDIGETLVNIKIGDGSQKDKGGMSGWMLYAKGAGSNDNKFNPRGLAGSKMVDAGTIVNAFGMINMTLGGKPQSLLEIIGYLNNATLFCQ